MPAITSSTGFQGCPVSGSIASGSATRNPAKGSTSSEGMGMTTLSRATMRATPT